jgi:hypothetical protein
MEDETGGKLGDEEIRSMPPTYTASEGSEDDADGSDDSDAADADSDDSDGDADSDDAG